MSLGQALRKLRSGKENHLQDVCFISMMYVLYFHSETEFIHLVVWSLKETSTKLGIK